MHPPPPQLDIGKLHGILHTVIVQNAPADFVSCFRILGYISVVCKHIWIDVMSTCVKNNSGDQLLRYSMVVGRVKESRTHIESTRLVVYHCFKGSISRQSVTADLNNL